MKKLSLATALFASLFAFNTNAYQYEVNGAYENTDIDHAGDIDTWSISGKYYLNPVQAKSAPLAEAAFLNKSSNIGLGYVNASGDGDEDIDIYGVSGEFFIPDTKFYLSGSLNQVDVADEDNTGYTVEAGYLPIDGLLLAIGVSKESLDPVLVSKNGLVTTLGYADAIGEDTTVSARGKYVTQIGGFYTNFEGVAYFGDETAYKLGADLYLDPTLSVGVSFADSTADHSDTIFNVRAQKFFTQQFAVGVGYTTVDGADSYGINGTYRF
ncbi:putative porin [Acinetobacter puyangensis]|uniref:putative porin n=1 Tax=Acinetobacter puyangensis TaxID=1096779 RepID=UPI003A4DC326